MNYLYIDFETRSELDLKKVGAAKYAMDTSTEIICMAWKINSGPASVYTTNGPIIDKLEYALKRGFTFVAHNAGFEAAIMEHVLKIKVPAHRWKCTAAKAAACALPRSLEGACNALELSVRKNMQGNKLIKKYMKPRQAWVEWKALGGRGPEPKKYFDDPFDLDFIYRYCATDVFAEFLLDKALPDLPPLEQKIWQTNLEINLRGVSVDVSTVKTVLNQMSLLTDVLLEELNELTQGTVATAGQRDRLLNWLRKNGVQMQNLSARTVSDTIDTLRPSKARRVLEIRKALSKSSTKKYEAMLARACDDGRVRDLAMYHGAHTGRDTGKGLQILNLPRGKIKNTDRAIKHINTNDLEYLKALYGSPFDVYSACIRGMITASPGYNLFAADLNAIECRVLNWIAGNEAVLKDFREGIDLYVKMAKRIGSDDRQLGKTIELASGYQMGPQKLFDTCIAWGVNGGQGIAMPLAEKAIKAYRESHAPVVKLWAWAEGAAIRAAKTREPVSLRSGLISYQMDGRFLTCRLPSGRNIYYFRPEVRVEKTPWGEMRPKLYYWKTNSLTKKWECRPSYGGLLVENFVQSTARDLLYHNTLRLTERGYRYLFNVYDELVGESKSGTVADFVSVLLSPLPWAKGLPLEAAGWTGYRYRKA